MCIFLPTDIGGIFIKRFLSVSIILGLIFSPYLFKLETVNASVTNANGLSISAEEYQRLLTLGFTDEEITNMDQEELEMNKELSGELTTATTQYLKIIDPTSPEIDSQSQVQVLSEQTYNYEVDNYVEDASDGTTTSYKKMTTTITKLSTNSYRLKNSVTWSRIPATRHVDVTGVGINQSFWGPTPNSQYGKQNWKTYSYCNGTQSGSSTYNTSSDKWKKGSGGYSLKVNLPGDEIVGGCAADKVTALSSYMYYSVTPLTSTNRLDGYGQYAHQVVDFTLTPSISLNGAEFTVSPTEKFSEHPNTHVLQYK